MHTADAVYCLASRYTVHAELKTEIRCFIIASGKQVRRTREKQLITVFREAMSHVASRTSKACLMKLCDTKVDGQCGARVNNKGIISRSVLISWYISALPQYLERFAARYTNPLRV